MFSLSYLPTAERLTIVIVKARNLKWADPARDSGGKDVVYFIILFCCEHRRRCTFFRFQCTCICNRGIMAKTVKLAVSMYCNLLVLTWYMYMYLLFQILLLKFIWCRIIEKWARRKRRSNEGRGILSSMKPWFSQYLHPLYP